MISLVAVYLLLKLHCVSWTVVATKHQLCFEPVALFFITKVFCESGIDKENYTLIKPYWISRHIFECVKASSILNKGLCNVLALQKNICSHLITMLFAQSIEMYLPYLVLLSVVTS